MKIYLSSAENSNNKKILAYVKEPKRLLLSYYYMKGKSDEKIKEMVNNFLKAGNDLMLDSGAHTFLNEIDSQTSGRKGIAQKKMTKTKETPQEYFEGYLKFLEKYHTCFSFIAELDVDVIVGYPLILKWRKRMENLGIAKEKIINVWHPTIPNGKDEWERWCKEGYICGIGGFPSIEIYNMLFQIANKHNARVHGFAMTKTWYMQTYPWFSVDSSSWNIGQRFGTVYYYDPATISVKPFHLGELRTNKGRMTMFLKTVYPKLDLEIPIHKLLKERSLSYIIDICNVYAFLKLEKALTSLWKARGVEFK